MSKRDDEFNDLADELEDTIGASLLLPLIGATLLTLMPLIAVAVFMTSRPAVAMALVLTMLAARVLSSASRLWLWHRGRAKRRGRR